METILREILGQLNTARAKLDLYEPKDSNEYSLRVSAKSDIVNAIENIEMQLLSF